MESWQITPWESLDAVIRILVAALFGAAMGFEREQAKKPAGFRTFIMVCVGAALITMVSIYGFGDIADPGRVAAGIVVGVGFLGAGTIFRSGGNVTGLTTAATIWTVAGIGLAVGAGLYLIALAAVIITIIVLRLPYQQP